MKTKQNYRIIVIDDDHDIWDAYKAILAPAQFEGQFAAGQRIAELVADTGRTPPAAQESFDLSFASQGQEGYHLVAEAIRLEKPYAVAFVDVRMPPGWDGLETAERIRAIDPDIEIVIVTAYADRSRDEIARAVRPPHKLLYLRKPFDLDELKQIALSLSQKWNISRLEEQQREELTTILKTTPAAIFTTDGQRRITSWNRAAELITGYPAEEVLGQPCIFQTIANEDLCRRCRTNSLISQTEHTAEVSFNDRRGKLRTISINASPLNNRKGESIGIVESFWDITSRKEAEEALHESEERFRSLVETISDWVWEVDSSGRFTYCSPVCQDIYGYLPAELLGRSLFEILVAEDSRKEFEGRFQQALADRRGFQGVERRVARKDDRVIFVESSATPVTSPKGEIVGFHCIDRDITERKRMEKEKSSLEERYHQAHKLEALGTLAGGIAHDFNNILTPIIGYAQLGELNLERGEHDKVKECFNIIRNSAGSAADLTKQILAYSRQQVLDIRKVNLSETIDTMGKMLHRLIREDITLEFDLARDVRPIRADAGRLGQVLINLVVNAKDAIAGGGRIIITARNIIIPAESPLVDAEKNPFSGSFVLLQVQDNGAGMDQKTQERIFDPFFTTKPVGQGTGIGLSTVFGIVKQHGASIVLNSRPGQGTTVQIYFRIEEKAPEAGESSKTTASIAKGSETILVVEDSREVLTAISVGLKAYGYNVIEANGSEKGIEVIHAYKDKIDMLITDVVMPGLSGRAVAETFRIKFDYLPILFISGYSSEIDAKDLEIIRRSHFLQKPFSPSEIAAKVRAILDGEEKSGYGAGENKDQSSG